MTAEIVESHIQARIKSERIVIFESDNVYDVTEFADRHPGGKKYLEEHCGQDVSQLMQKDPHIHSKAAYSMMKKYCIGKRQHIKSQNGVRNRKTNDSDITNNNTDQIQDGLIDWSKPIVWQVPSLGDKYFDWVHVPVDTHMRLFQWDFVEYFSQCSWYIVPIFWLPVMFILIGLSYYSLVQNPVEWPANSSYSITINGWNASLLYLLGLMFWTLEEYIIHRWLFHMKPPAGYPSLILVHFLLHGQHHKTPMDSKRLVFPPIPAIGLGMVMYSLYCMFMPSSAALMMFAGSIGGYLAYDMIHYYLHHGVPSTTYFKSLKRYHVRHHFENQQKGFGISSKMWDYPFHTLIEG
ncbi:fatty acid 2-hydroxylase-like [Mytilus galloprovincialis]|uniref:Fatty acid 2-hydroxylase n=1 Tax=Mytilus galloprovincialis TaxID=29158 RepID=A0A8B6CAZ2_MYTGA|nr:4-hydroxysphinganine ceramide fatty acyl 2-hydroxylase [Mytilus galloprovincialis]